MWPWSLQPSCTRSRKRSHPARTLPGAHSGPSSFPEYMCRNQKNAVWKEKFSFSFQALRSLCQALLWGPLQRAGWPGLGPLRERVSQTFPQSWFQSDALSNRRSAFSKCETSKGLDGKAARRPTWQPRPGHEGRSANYLHKRSLSLRFVDLIRLDTDL